MKNDNSPKKSGDSKFRDFEESSLEASLEGSGGPSYDPKITLPKFIQSPTSQETEMQESANFIVKKNLKRPSSEMSLSIGASGGYGGEDESVGAKNSPAILTFQFKSQRMPDLLSPTLAPMKFSRTNLSGEKKSSDHLMSEAEKLPSPKDDFSNEVSPINSGRSTPVNSSTLPFDVSQLSIHEKSPRQR